MPWNPRGAREGRTKVEETYLLLLEVTVVQAKRRERRERVRPWSHVRRKMPDTGIRLPHYKELRECASDSFEYL